MIYNTYNNNLFKANKIDFGTAFVPHKAGNNTSHVVLILDESGSMSSVRDTTISAINEFVESQRINAKETGIKTYISLYKFDGENVNSVYSKLDAFETPKLSRDNYIPNGGTNLMDAIGTVVSSINNSFSDIPQNLRSSVIVTVVTDGEENMSRVYDNKDIKQMISKCEDYNWGFLFLGAKVDAFASANFGFNYNNTIQLSGSTASVSSGIMSASRAVNSMKSAYSSDSASTSTIYDQHGFTDAERKKSK